MRTVEIGRVVDPIEKWDPRRDGAGRFTYIDLSSVDKKTKVVAEPTTVEASEAPSRARQLIASGDVLVSTVRPNLNAVAYVQQDLDGATASTGFCVLRPRPDELEGRYLYHWARTAPFIGHLVQLATGASYPAVSDKIVKAAPIPLPPLDEQRRVAAVLDAADGLRAKRHKTLAKLECLTEAVFIDMFGDPMSGNRYSRVPIGSVVEIVTGNTPSRSIAENYAEHIEWLKSDNILESGKITSAAEHLSELGRAKGREAPAGSTLVVCIAGSPRSIGRAGLLDRTAAFNQQINAVLPGPSALPEFVFHQLKVCQQLVQRASTNSMKGMVSKSALAAVEILIPPIEIQRGFVEYVEAVERVRSASSESLIATDALLASLQQRAFRGEL